MLLPGHNPFNQLADSGHKTIRIEWISGELIGIVAREHEVVVERTTANDVLHVTPQTGLVRQKFTFFGEEFDCELCLDQTSRNTGMGARTEFPDGTAMIFVHPNPTLLNYWMKDCLIDMDMVMVDDTGIISALHEGVREKLRTKQESLREYEDRLRRYSSYRRAKYVIEFPAGTIARLKPKQGQRIAIDWKSLDARAK